GVSCSCRAHTASINNCRVFRQLGLYFHEDVLSCRKYSVRFHRQLSMLATVIGYHIRTEQTMIEIQNIEQLIRNESNKVSKSFADIFLNGVVAKFSFIIDENKLDPKYFDKVNITLDGDFSSHF